MALKLITFDLDNTLWPVDEVIRHADQTCMQWIEQQHPEAANKMTMAELRPLRDQLVHSNPQYLHDLTALRTDMLAAGFQQAGYPEKEARTNAEKAFRVFHDARNEIQFFPGALNILEQLAGQYALGALSNGNADLKKIGIDRFFDFHHSAETIGKRKPAPDMFQAALQSSGHKATETLHIGDHPLEDIHAAREQGFHTIWANLLHLSWPEELEPCPHHIHNLHELPDRIALFL